MKVHIPLIVLGLLLVAAAVYVIVPVKDITGFYPVPKTEGTLQELNLPEGFRIEYFAQNVDGARSMAYSDSGILFVGTRTAGKVYALLDYDKDWKVDHVVTIAEGLTLPNGVALKDGHLYVAEVDKILRYDNIEDNLFDVPAPRIINDQFPSHPHHGWKFIRFGPDGKLYVPVGVPCNVCEEQAPYGTITRMNPDGTGLEVFAEGVRNTVGFDWQASTDDLWWTDNGRDWWGDEVPPDELNRAPTKGMHFGFPYCHGTMIDDEFNTAMSCSNYTEPALNLDPHVAALGMRFYQGAMFPENYQGGIFIAEHGSWNRKEPIGYRVKFVSVSGPKAESYEDFVTGWLKDGKSWGRPVDVEILPDGSMLISDDLGDAIYRVSYGE